MEVLLKKRIFAFIIDFLAVTALMWILTVIIYPLVVLIGSFAVFNYWLVLLGLVILLYFALLEGYQASTLGKNIVGIEVKSVDGQLTYKQTFIRNLSKILWVPLIFDILGARLSKTESYRMLDDYAGTEVILSHQKKEKTLE